MPSVEGLTKRRASLRDAPKTHGFPALAWTNNDGVVRYVVPGRRRFAHESAHNLRQQNNTMHDGHTLHFCVLSWHPFRLHDGCATPVELRAGELLLGVPDGVAVYPQGVP